VDVPSRPDDALAQPTRARLFALLGELRRPVPTGELAERVGLHPNGVRNHLERLREVGLVTRQRERLARGRPRYSWIISPDAQPGGDPPTAYAELARWLLRSLVSESARVRDVEATGREIGRELALTETGVTGEQRMHEVLAALGFQPERERSGDDLTYRLRNCPYRDAVATPSGSVSRSCAASTAGSRAASSMRLIRRRSSSGSCPRTRTRPDV
jgi:predicted ArsR family transcriptional regulator